jgi:Tol biopolymer transport system component
MPTNRIVSMLACLGLLFATGCQPSAAPANQPPISIIETALVTRLTVTPPSPETTLSSTPSAVTFTLSPTALPSHPVVRACVTQSDSQHGLIAHGVLVLESFENQSLNSEGLLYDLDQKVLDKLPASGKFADFIGVSPDRKKLLYDYENQPNTPLVLADFRGKLIKTFDYKMQPTGWWDYFSWLNANTLRAVQQLRPIDINRTANPTVQATAQAFFKAHPDIWGAVFLYRYDPLTGDYAPLRTEWPDAYKGKDLDWLIDTQAIQVRDSYGANMIYDPATTRLVYPKNGENISLTDVESGKELASTHLPGWGRLPRWSDDGRNLILIANAGNGAAAMKDDFFIVSSDGSGGFRQLTHLSNEFDQDYIADYAWSPDGQQIAFWLNTALGDQTQAKTGSELALLDISTGAITNLCIQGLSAKFNRDEDVIHMIHPQPVWSPDGSQVMITQLEPQNNKKYAVLVVDIASAHAYKIVENLEPIGWMTKEP